MVSANNSEPVTPERELVGAVCVIRADNKMVMLSEMITRKMALPGGYIDGKDSPEQSAIREALEETGIDVEIDHLIQYRGRAAIYACVAKSPILVSTTTDTTGFAIVESSSSEHFGKEVRRVYLVEPSAVTAEEYRFPKDKPRLAKWLAETPESEISYYSDLSERANHMHQFELEVIKGFQQSIKQMSPSAQAMFEAAMTVLNLPGETVFIAILVVATAAMFGVKSLLRLAFVLLSVTYIASVLKLSIASPRPFYIIPELKQANAYGFGFPSGHTLMATVLWGLAWYYLARKRGLRVMYSLLPVAFLFAIGQATARVWYGVHFITDTIASIMLGSGMVAVYIAWLNSEDNSLDERIVGKGFWLIMALIVGLTASFSHAPDHTYLFAVLLGVLLSLDYVDWKVSARQLSYPKQAISFVVISVGVMAIASLTLWAANQSSMSLVVLTVRSIGGLLVAIWLTAGTSMIHKRLSR
ncbi:phosphatase PAP2 family protein [Photobacterium jeanii]|nr:phosphatase PAP2 family protein [Photobacterium jeanii]